MYKVGRYEKLVSTVFLLIFLVPALVYILFFLRILTEGAGVINWHYLTAGPSSDPAEGGIGPVIAGTLFTVILMLMIVIPMGVMTALYLSEYSINRRFEKFLLFLIHNLAGVPSVVFGAFGLGFFVLNIGTGLDTLLGLHLVFGKPSMLWASVTLAFMLMPMVVTTAYEAFRAVPPGYRETAYSAGAGKLQMIRHVVIPHSIQGVSTGIILSVTRAIGETAPILFLGCAFFLPSIPVVDLCIAGLCLPVVNPTEQFMYLSYNLFIMSTQSTASLPYQYAGVLVLIVLTVVCNGITIWLRGRFRRSMAFRETA